MYKEEFEMLTWSNLDTLASYQELSETKPVELAKEMSGENGAERVKKYSVPMAAGLGSGKIIGKKPNQHHFSTG